MNDEVRVSEQAETAENRVRLGADIALTWVDHLRERGVDVVEEQPEITI